MEAINAACMRAGLKGEVTEQGVFASGCQYILSPHRWTGNRTVIQMQHPTPLSFPPWFFCFTKEKPQINQGFLSPSEPTKSLEKPEKTYK